MLTCCARADLLRTLPRRSRALELLGSLGFGGSEGGGRGAAELAELLWSEMGLPDAGPLTEAAWSGFMTRYLRRWGGAAHNQRSVM